METLSYCQLMERMLAAEARVTELESGKVGNALLERENHHVELAAENVALEKAQTKADVYDMLRDDYGLREIGVGLADFVDWQAKRIAELESRTVKMPQRHSMLLREDFNEDYHTEMAYKADEVQEALVAAGIKWEAE